MQIENKKKLRYCKNRTVKQLKTDAKLKLKKKLLRKSIAIIIKSQITLDLLIFARKEVFHNTIERC